MHTVASLWLILVHQGEGAMVECSGKVKWTRDLKDVSCIYLHQNPWMWMLQLCHTFLLEMKRFLYHHTWCDLIHAMDIWIAPKKLLIIVLVDQEGAFGILGARWWIYRTEIVGSIELIRNIIKATTFLHNWIITESLKNPDSEGHGLYTHLTPVDRALTVNGMWVEITL